MHSSSPLQWPSRVGVSAQRGLYTPGPKGRHPIPVDRQTLVKTWPFRNYSHSFRFIQWNGIQRNLVIFFFQVVMWIEMSWMICSGTSSGLKCWRLMTWTRRTSRIGCRTWPTTLPCLRSSTTGCSWRSSATGIRSNLNDGSHDAIATVIYIMRLMGCT